MFLNYFIDYFRTYWLDIVSPRVLLQMVRHEPLWVYVVFGLLAIRLQLPIFFIYASWLFRPGFWRQPAFNAGNGYPLVSVLIPFRNEGPGIVDAARSVLACGWPNIEVVLIDDCSTDGSWRYPKELERTGRVRVFRLPRHGGKATALSTGLALARGNYILVMDADNRLELNSLTKMMGVITSDHRIGGLGCVFRVLNPDATIITLWQEWYWGLAVMPARMLRAKIGMLSIISGGCGLFRAQALREIGGYDAGLGDDTDVTLRLRKARWRLSFCHDATCWALVPTTLGALARQQMRWERNMVKIRIHKHWDMIMPWRYGWVNMVFFLDTLITRVAWPLTFLMTTIWFAVTYPFITGVIVNQAFWFYLFFGVIKATMARDVTGTPRLQTYLYLPLYPPIYYIVRLCILYAMVMEFLRIGVRHRYVPNYIWREAPRW